MSKPVTRIVISVLLSLLVIAVVYTSVLGASSAANKTGTHLVSGAKVNLDHYRLASVDQGSSASFDSLTTQKEGGHGCGSDQASSFED